MTKATAQITSTSPGSDHEDRFATLRQPPPTQPNQRVPAPQNKPRSYAAILPDQPHNQQSSWHEAAGQAAQNSISKERRGVPAAISATHRPSLSNPAESAPRHFWLHLAASTLASSRPSTAGSNPPRPRPHLRSTHRQSRHTLAAVHSINKTGEQQGGKEPRKEGDPAEEAPQPHKERSPSAARHMLAAHHGHSSAAMERRKDPRHSSKGAGQQAQGSIERSPSAAENAPKPIQQKTQHQRGSEQPPHQELPQKARQAFTDRQSASGTAVWGQGRDMLAARHRTAANTGRSQPKKQSQRQSLGR